jgi:hypothetical protein
MSLKGFTAYQALYPDVNNNLPLYLIHNLHMQTACAMMGKGYDYSANAAEACRASFDTSFMSLPVPLGNFIQYVYMISAFNNVRFGKWDAILKAPVIPRIIFLQYIGPLGPGHGICRQNKFGDAKKELSLPEGK